MVSVLSFYSNNPCLNPAGQGWPIFKNIVGKNEVLSCSKCGHYWWCRGECLPKGGTWFDSRHRLIFYNILVLTLFFSFSFCNTHLGHQAFLSFCLYSTTRYFNAYPSFLLSFFSSSLPLSAICTKYTNGISLSLSSVNLTL